MKERDINQDPQSQQFYRKFGNLALTAGGLFLGFKALQTLYYKIFGSEDKKKSHSR